MKKIVSLLVVLIVLFGCVSIPQEQYDMLQGTWVREDGATITFNGRNWETVDMTNGSAGYGTFEIRKDNRIQFTHTDIMNLKFLTSYYAGIKNGKRLSTGAEIKEFQMRAWEEFNRLYPERILQYSPEKEKSGYDESSSSSGGAPRDYILEGNSLTLIQYYTSPSPYWVAEPIKGVFIRQ